MSFMFTAAYIATRVAIQCLNLYHCLFRDISIARSNRFLLKPYSYIIVHEGAIASGYTNI